MTHSIKSLPAVHKLQLLLGSQVFLDALPIGVYCCDSNGFIRHFNRHAAELWGRSPQIGDKDEQFCGSYRLFLLDGSELRHDKTPMAEVLHSGKAARDKEVILERPDGSRITVLVNINPLLDEQGELIGAVNCFQDISERHKAEVASAHLASIVASSDDAIVSKTLDGVVYSWNDGARRIFGYEAEEMIGQPILRIIPPDLHDEEKEILNTLRKGEHLKHFETVRVTKNGDRIHISLTVSPIYDKAGRVTGASTVARDISDRKGAEEERELLARELSHRVKNSLAIVQSLASQTTGRTVEEFRQRFIGRLQALACAHNLLLDTNWRSADLRLLVEGALEPYRVDGPEGHEIRGEPLDLTPKQTLGLNFVLHELATNAVKYGALSQAEGRLNISWRVETTDSGDQVLFLWEESGGPKISAPDEMGFGTSLIERACSYELNGRVEQIYASDGLVCKIAFPLAS